MIVSQLDYITGYKALSSIQGSDVCYGRWSLLLCGFLGFYGQDSASELLLMYQDKESACRRSCCSVACRPALAPAFAGAGAA